MNSVNWRKQKDKIVIVGCGETANLAFEYFTKDSESEVVGFAVDEKYKNSDSYLSLPLFSLDKIPDEYRPSNVKAFIALSSTQMNRHRTNLFRKVEALGYDFTTYVSSHAFVWDNVEIGRNCFVLEDNTIQPFCSVGNNVTLWSGNHIGHQSKILDNAFISSHCVISGFCTIGEFSFLGVNSTIEDGIVIAKDTFLGAGSLVRKSTVENGLYQTLSTEVSKVDTHRLFKIKE